MRFNQNNATQIFLSFIGFNALTLLIPETSHAYFGPGAGLGLIGSLIAVVVIVLTLLFGVFFYPIKMWLKKRKEEKGEE